METKKPLIIVTPMSDPLKKLREVLDGITAEEGIEIYLVEDSREFGQLVGSGGQALVLMSNAKMCATLLQENKNILSKNHTKVILLTAKEIPAKTLIKFTKIGLTEAILETSPPKTLLYKVKLLLRSIKAVQKEEDNQQLVKSMIDSGPRMRIADDLFNDATPNVGEITATATAEELELKKSEENEEKLDYLTKKKGNIGVAEDAIDTHWKGKNDRLSTPLQEEDDENKKARNDLSALSEIDKYYRGKKQKEETIIELEKNNELRLKTPVNEIEVTKNKKKQIEEALENIREENRRRKMTSIDEESVPEITLSKEVIEEQAPKERKMSSIEEFTDLESLQEKLLNEMVMDELDEQDQTKKEDLAGYYKGKVTRPENFNEEEATYKDKKVTEQIEEIEKKRKTREAENLIEEDQLRDKLSTIEDSEDAPHEGQVDHLSDLMIGELNPHANNKLDLLSEDSNKKKQILEEILEEDKKNKNKLTELEDEDKDYREKKAQDELDLINDKNLDLEKSTLDDEKNSDLTTSSLSEEESDYKKRESEKIQNEELDQNRNENLKLFDNDDNNLRQLNKNDSNDEKEFKNRSSKSSDLDIEPGDKKYHDGKTERINTFYRSGETKDNKQDWNLPKENKNTNIELKHAKQEDINLGQLKNKKFGEETIDYRKLKEEFEQLIKNEKNPNTNNNNTDNDPNAVDPDYKDSFKVVEVLPNAFDFSIEIINLIYSPDLKPKEITKTVAEKLIIDEKAYLVTTAYSAKENKYIENFNSYTELRHLSKDEYISDWEIIKNDPLNIELFKSFSMPTYLCREIKENDSFWKDIELPAWAQQELTNKKVELIYPFFDGVEPIGYAHLLFPEGIKTINDKKIQITIDYLRTVFLEFAPKISKNNISTDENKTKEQGPDESNKGKVLNLLSGLFGKKKAG